ncbi:MAG: TatD family hydrolase [Acidobacteriota bacterium]
MFIDSHAHLDLPELLADLEGVLSRARESGVIRILTIACAGAVAENLSKVGALAQQHEEVYAAMGVHPHDAQHFSEELGEQILHWMDAPKVLGWGEIGLDFFYDNSPRDAQLSAFRRQLQLARAARKPVIIHSREAANDTCRILEEEFSAPDCPGGVMHCFTYDQSIARRCLDLGFYLAFGGMITFPRSEPLREIARTVPLDRFLIETDSPYLAPVPFRGQRNEPAHVREVAEKLAQVRATTCQAIGARSSENFCRLFSCPM